MDLVAVILHKVHAEGVSIREVARESGSRATRSGATRAPSQCQSTGRCRSARHRCATGGGSRGVDLEVASLVHGRQDG